jgi:hypothetical protein
MVDPQMTKKKNVCMKRKKIINEWTKGNQMYQNWEKKLKNGWTMCTKCMNVAHMI